MLKTQEIRTYERIFNGLELAGILLMLVMAFGFQLILNELPCPLCLLQRVGFLSVALGFLMNLRFGLRPSHYAISLISALFTSFVALRQIALHVVPGTGTYGSAFLGMHLYTWSFVVCMLIVIVTIIMLSVDRQYQLAHKTNLRKPMVTHILFAVVALLILANIVTVILQCGLRACPDNPEHYLLFEEKSGV